MKKLKIGLAGLGIVGKSVYDILLKDQEIINARSANKLELVAVSARSKKDFIDESKVRFVANSLDLASDPEIDIIVEVIGGDGIASEILETAIKNGKKVVTANKALLAVKGLKLAALAEENGGYIGFEASVAGAIPIVKTFKEGLAANEIKEFYAILNGTCNYILTKMKNENIDFSVALKQAQDLGYAESDPTFDIEGVDTAHKLTLLAAIASGCKPDFNDIYIEGITKVNVDDIRLADELGYKIKLLAVYKNAGAFQAVYPALVSVAQKISQVDDSFNAILTRASNAGENLAIGRGAGGLPTASSVVADLIDIANDRYSFEFGVKVADLKDAAISKIEERVGGYFVKLTLDKELAQTQKLDEKFLQEIKAQKTYFEEMSSGEVLCGLITGDVKEKDLQNLLKNLDQNLVKAVKFIRIENL